MLYLLLILAALCQSENVLLFPKVLVVMLPPITARYSTQLLSIHYDNNYNQIRCEAALYVLAIVKSNKSKLKQLVTILLLFL